MTSNGEATTCRKAAAQAAVILFAAGAMKWFYSVASVEQLKWILWPTKLLVELVTGTRFYFEPHAGYMSEDRVLLIAGVCSGVNFLIAMFLMLALRRVWTNRGEGASWTSLSLIAAMSYLVTIFANSLRISSALWLLRGPHEMFGLDRDEMHRLDGILIYFGLMLVVYTIVNGDRVRGWRRFVFPLMIYYAVTLVVPVLNGAVINRAFLQHAAFVVAVPLLLVASFAAAARLFFDRHAEGIAAGAAGFPGDTGSYQVGTGANV